MFFQCAEPSGAAALGEYLYEEAGRACGVAEMRGVMAMMAVKLVIRQLP